MPQTKYKNICDHMLELHLMPPLSSLTISSISKCFSQEHRHTKVNYIFTSILLIYFLFSLFLLDSKPDYMHKLFSHNQAHASRHMTRLVTHTILHGKLTTARSYR
uniref:Uncharacterized protein n=1 Tax=Aegilops tauschii subsp. strangulata TaxID=200361 RepID=A0A453D7R2_AEGTS